MNAEQARALLVQVFGRVAPEIDLSTVDPTESLTDQLAIDSMDQLNVMQGVHDATGLDIPERDYAQLETLNAFVNYLAAKVN
jgi:acyl carrier protein